MELQSQRKALAGVQRVIVKLGTSSCLAEGGRVRGEVILPLARDIAALRERGVKVVLVSSGAVGMGRRTAWGARIDSREVSAKQALAALGQVRTPSGASRSSPAASRERSETILAMLGANSSRIRTPTRAAAWESTFTE